jgi:uncharacterized protein YlxP (DUF503 family)
LLKGRNKTGLAFWACEPKARSRSVPAVVGLLTIELHISGARSLKEKRMVVRSLRERLKKFNVAVAEIEFQDLWQRAALGVVAISNEQAHVDQTLASVADEVERLEPGLIASTEVEFLT